MEKKIIQEPVYETVQTGFTEKVVWATSDGKEFDNENSAKYHEFYNLKIKERSAMLPDNATVIDFYSVDDLEKYEKQRLYNENIKYDKNNLQFPNTFVIYEEYEEDDNDDYGYQLYDVYCVTVGEFKKIINERLDSITKI